MVSSSFQTENLRCVISVCFLQASSSFARTVGHISVDRTADIGRTGGVIRLSLGICLVLCVRPRLRVSVG